MTNGDLVSEFDEYRDIFLSELEEIMSSMNKALLELEKNPNNKDRLNEVMRAAHTIKGMAGTMGFDLLATLTHKVEDSLLKLLEEETIHPRLIDALFEFADKLQEFKDAIIRGSPLDQIHVKTLIDKIEGFAEGRIPEIEEKEAIPSSASVADILEPELKLGSKYQIIIEFRPDAPLKSARALVAIRQLENIAQILVSKPSLNDIEEGKVFDKIDLEVISNEDETAIRKSLQDIQDIKSVEVIPLHEEVTEVEETAAPTLTFRERRKTIQTVRINLDLLDYVLDLLGEIILASGKISRELQFDFNSVISQQVGNIETSVVQIQEVIMRMRMVTLTHIFDRLPRMVRDLAKEQGKKAELIIRGSHLELDRSVIDQVNEAVLHILRNAVSHGIESPSERRRGGKSETGRIIVEAAQERGEIIITVSDDGAGINFKEIEKRAKDLGLYKDEEPMSRRDLLQLIFESGFSTAKKTSEAAGRGVGLDIVKQVIEEIGGTIQVDTVEGKGTTFTIRVPQTVAIVEAIILEEGGFQFALPMTNVEVFLTSTDALIVQQGSREYISYQDELVPLIDIRSLVPSSPVVLALQARGITNVEETGSRAGSSRRRKRREKIIIWRKAGKRIALRVRNLVGQTDIVTKSISTIGDSLPGISGATILGEEQVVLIIDPAGFIR